MSLMTMLKVWATKVKEDAMQLTTISITNANASLSLTLFATTHRMRMFVSICHNQQNADVCSLALLAPSI